MADYLFPPSIRESGDSTSIRCPICGTLYMDNLGREISWFVSHFDRYHHSDTLVKPPSTKQTFSCPHCGQEFQVTLSKGGIE